jgi:TonB family protein
MGYSASPPVLFSLLPKTRTPWTEFVFSSGTQACLVAFLLWMRMLHPGIVAVPEHTFRSVQLVSTPAPVNHQPQPKRPSPQPVYLAKVDTPDHALRLPVAAAKVNRMDEAAAPAVRIAPQKMESVPLDSAPVIPKVVATNLFSTGSSAAPTSPRDAAHVQTGGFADPRGIPAKANQGNEVNIAAAGSFDLPLGGGYGNGSGGTKGTRGVVASSGFGSGTAVGNGQAQPSAAAVQQTGFGDAGAPAPPASHSTSVQMASAPVLPAEIISKPTPTYTAEARSLGIQGEVLLEVVLQASGSLQVVRVVRGLGHGLDDNAVKAAEQIRFRPAMRNGQPVASTVVLHIVFQLA